MFELRLNVGQTPGHRFNPRFGTQARRDNVVSAGLASQRYRMLGLGGRLVEFVTKERNYSHRGGRPALARRLSGLARNLRGLFVLRMGAPKVA